MSYISSGGKFKVTLPLTSSPNRTYPRNPSEAYKIITVNMAIFKTPGQPKNCWGFAISFSTGMTAPIPSMAKITVEKKSGNVLILLVINGLSEKSRGTLNM